MDAGIIKSTKGKARKRFVEWVLEIMESYEQVTGDKLKPDIRQAVNLVNNVKHKRLCSHNHYDDARCQIPAAFND